MANTRRTGWFVGTSQQHRRNISGHITAKTSLDLFSFTTKRTQLDWCFLLNDFSTIDIVFSTDWRKWKESEGAGEDDRPPQEGDRACASRERGAQAGSRGSVK